MKFRRIGTALRPPLFRARSALPNDRSEHTATATQWKTKQKKRHLKLIHATKAMSDQISAILSPLSRFFICFTKDAPWRSPRLQSCPAILYVSFAASPRPPKKILGWRNTAGNYGAAQTIHRSPRSCIRRGGEV